MYALRMEAAALLIDSLRYYMRAYVVLLSYMLILSEYQTCI